MRRRILDEFDCIGFQQAEARRLVERRHLVVNVFLYSRNIHKREELKAAAHQRHAGATPFVPTT